jgi:hypothetical protein
MKPVLLAALLAAAVVTSGALALTPSSNGFVFACEEEADGNRIEVKLTEVQGDRERELEIEVEANARFRIEVEVEEEQAHLAPSSDDGDHDEDHDDAEDVDDADEADAHPADHDEREREARVEVCGFVQFVDENGNGVLDGSDTVVPTDGVTFGPIEHRVEDGVHEFVATTLDGTLTVTAQVPATFPAEGEPLVRWTVEATPTCEEDATHFAVKLEQRGAEGIDGFLVAACGTTLSAAGEA